MCVVLKAVRLYPALLNDQLRCVLSQPGEFWQRWPWAAEHWCQKAAYLDGWVHYHLLITGGFSGVFITCADWGCVCVCIQGLLLHQLNGRGSAGVCLWGVGGSKGSCFSSAVGSLQYSWALRGSVCCAQASSASQTAFFTPCNYIKSLRPSSLWHLCYAEATNAAGLARWCHSALQSFSF